MVEKLEINNTCIPCDSCRMVCPENAIITDGEKFQIDPWGCTKCGLCIEICPTDAIKIREYPR